MKHVRWIDPESADDHTVHFLFDSEWTFCGLAFEGVDRRAPHQGFKVVREKVDCPICIHRVNVSKQVKTSEIKLTL